MEQIANQPLLIAGGVAAVLAVALIGVMIGRRRREEEQAIRRSQTLRVVSVVVLLGAIVAFAAANVHQVSISWLFTETRAPMVLVIVLSGGVGFLIGALVASRRRVE